MPASVVFAGDRSMQTLIPVRFAESRSFADMAAVVSGGVNSIVTLEHSDQRTPLGTREPATEIATLRVWAAVPGTGLLRETARASTPLPVSSAVAITVRGSDLLALAQVNQIAAAYLMSAGWPPPAAASLVMPFTTVAPIGLDPALAQRVQIEPRDDWSTFGLASRRWLFNPSVTEDPESGAVILAMNTADGQAVVWRWLPGQGAAMPQRMAVVPAALDPVLLRAGGRTWLLYRRMPDRWSVFFHDLRYSSRFGPFALPLMMAQLDAGGAVVHTDDLSATELGPVFAFAAQAVPTGWVLSVVGGSTVQPELRIAVDEPFGGTPRLQAASALRAVPCRLTLGATDQAALVGLAYKNSGSYALEAMTVTLR
jgi:hypothetical protein